MEGSAHDMPSNTVTTLTFTTTMFRTKMGTTLEHFFAWFSCAISPNTIALSGRDGPPARREQSTPTGDRLHCVNHPVQCNQATQHFSSATAPS
ncbi:uncharacterized protein LOC118504824 isoform X2 [Anopheles stephensi]|uniref:uncharacterized protein LOC118504824 isoform X2 n=1 Tax=Anopheles stephensi TaxID=30069 RepID=UPI0016588894|nr:uncharacterized protein LOC118504824 isoform X2 [Anopheles stephensi]